MAGLLDNLMNDPQQMGLLMGAASMLQASGPSRTPVSLGQVLSSGLLGGMEGYGAVQNAQTQKQYRDMQMKRYGMAAEKDQMEMEQLRAAQEKQKRISEAYQSFGAPPDISSVMAAPGRVGPTPERAALVQQQPDLSSPYKRNLAMAQHLESKGLHEQANKLYEIAQKSAPKVQKWSEIQQNGQVMFAPFFEDGSAGAPVPMEVARKMEFRDFGGSVGGIDPYTGQQGFNQKKTQSPDSVASNAVAMRGQNMVDARARAALDLQRQELSGGGKAPAGYRWKPDGSLETIAGGPADKLPESQQKQVTGVNNLSNAITEYRNDLNNFGFGLSPEKRAVMGTKYNNMMLQAKEAYNLGVLNGPDYDILTSIVTDPTSGKGFFMTNSALDKQASELDRIMQQVGRTSSVVRPNATQGGNGNIDALLKKYGG